MTLLYGSRLSLEQSSSAPNLKFSCHNLRLTQDLLQDTKPALARQLSKLLQRCQFYQIECNTERRQVEFYPLVDELGAQTIAAIIAGLTAMGDEWLEQPMLQQDNKRPLKQLLDEWINLGDWLVHVAVVH